MNELDGLAVEVDDVRLRYGRTEALRGLSFAVPAGTICGLLGRNGSGKTSLMSLLAALRRPTAGRVRVAGADPFEHTDVMPRVALIGEGSTRSKVHSVPDALTMARVLRPSWDQAYARRLLDLFGVPRHRWRPVAKLSRGQRAALGVVCGLAARAPLTMFDEPHLGMDAPSRYAFYEELLSDFMAHPRTIILSTHHIDEVATLFGQVLIIDRGRLVCQADADTLLGSGTEVTGPIGVVDRFTAGRTVLSQRQLGGTKAAVTYGELTERDRLAARELGLELGPIPLQDLFVQLTAPRETADQEPEQVS